MIIFHKRAILIACSPEFIENVLDIIFYPEYTKGPIMVELKKKFQNKISEMTGKRYIDVGFCKAVSTSYRFFQQLQKHYVASPTLIYF